MNSAAAQPLAVLIIGVEDDNQRLLKKQLMDAAEWSLTLESAADEDAALQKLQEAVYDLIFLDSLLPGTDGLETLSKIRQRHEKIAVVMITSRGDEHTAVAAMKKGAMDYLAHHELQRMDVRQIFRRLLEIRKLVNQNMELRQINQMKNEFIANVSHELRTPLSVVLGYAKAMQDENLGPITEGQKKALEAIIDRADGLLLTLNQILKIREAVEGRQQLLLKPTELRAWIGRYVSRPPRGLSKKKMSLKIDLPERETWVRANEEKLAEALDNLTSNAVKFGPEGSAVTISLQSGQGQARISVLDEGPGIPPELLPHLFEKMFAAGQGPTREYAGLGLGLSISQQIIEMHSGRIWLESKGPGLGCAAHISLPLSAQNSPELLVGRPGKFEKKRVLIVEDNPDLVEVLRLFMASVSPNLEIASTSSGFEALDSVKETIPHLIILDVMMPGMSGLEVIQRLRRSPDTAAIPVLVLTGYSEGAQMALKIGAKDVLLKPFEKNTFVKKVKRLLLEEPYPAVRSV